MFILTKLGLLGDGFATIFCTDVLINQKKFSTLIRLGVSMLPFSVYTTQEVRTIHAGGQQRDDRLSCSCWARNSWSIPFLNWGWKIKICSLLTTCPAECSQSLGQTNGMWRHQPLAMVPWRQGKSIAESGYLSLSNTRNRKIALIYLWSFRALHLLVEGNCWLFVHEHCSLQPVLWNQNLKGILANK